MFQVVVRVANPHDPARFFDEKFWVDTGALYTLAPENRLNEIGIRPLRHRELILADGRHDRRMLGEAVLTLPELDESLTCPLSSRRPARFTSWVRRHSRTLQCRPIRRPTS
jgi:predicted aspartyl protease